MPELTLDELTILISRFQNSTYRLRKSGDYPERNSDNKILKKLIEMKWTTQRKEKT